MPAFFTSDNGRCNDESLSFRVFQNPVDDGVRGGLADFLSTAAFLLPYEQSRALIEAVPEAEATWLLADGTEYCTEGFQKLMDLVK